MKIRKICLEALSVSQVLSVLELAQGIALVRPDWEQLRRELSRYDTWGFFDGEQLIGYALVNGRSPYFGGCLQLVQLRYDWRHNQEATIARMVYAVAQAYRQASPLMVVEVDARRDINFSLYRKLGFTVSLMRSALGKDHVVMLCEVESLLDNGFNT